MGEQRRTTWFLLFLAVAFMAAAGLLHVLGGVFYGGRDFRIALWTSTIGVMWGGAFASVFVLLSYAIGSRRSDQSKKTEDGGGTSGKRRSTKRKEEHEIIRALKWIYESRDFVKEDACEALDWSEQVWTMHYGELFREKPGSNGVYSMRYEAVINYLEYVELQEARKASKQAFWTAIAAIAISGFLALGGLGLPLYQIINTQ